MIWPHIRFEQTTDLAHCDACGATTHLPKTTEAGKDHAGRPVYDGAEALAMWMLKWVEKHVTCRPKGCPCAGAKMLECACRGALLDCPTCDGDGVYLCECQRETTN